MDKNTHETVNLVMKVIFIALIVVTVFTRIMGWGKTLPTSVDNIKNGVEATK